MIRFYREYATVLIVQQPAAQLPGASKVHQPAALLPAAAVVRPGKGTLQLPLASILWSIPWFHHILLVEKVKDFPTRLWYMQQTIQNGWSRNVLGLMIQTQAHARRGKAITNFANRLPPPQSDLAQGFAFVGRQFHVAVGEDDFYIDLLFYHLRLRCFVVIDLKTGAFEAEYAGKMNLYLGGGPAPQRVHRGRKVR